MKVLEGNFWGEIVVKLVPNVKCPTNNRIQGDDYFILQKKRLDDGTWINCPPNDVRIITRDLFVTCVQPGYYRFEIYGAKP